MSQPESPGTRTDERQMPFLSHLEELRWSIIRALIYVSAGAAVALFFVSDLMRILELPLTRAGLNIAGGAAHLRTISVGESFSVMITVAGMTGLAAAVPLILFEIWRFISPGMTAFEKRAVGPLIVFGAVFFYAGVAFCYYFVLPPALGYFLELNSYLGLVAEWRIKDYLSFALMMLLSCGLVAELPVVTVVLARFGIVSAPFMIHYWRHAVVALVILAAAITPSTDPVSMMLIAVPLSALYGLSIFLAKIFYVQR